MPSGSWNGLTYSGPFYSTSGSAWLGAAYDAKQLGVKEAGSMSLGEAASVSLSVNGSDSAIMSCAFTDGPFAGTTQSRQIVRQGF